MRPAMALSRAVREEIIKEAARLEDYLRKIEQTESDPRERARCQSVITDYLKNVEEFLASVKDVNGEGNGDKAVPKVTIGCRVKLSTSDGQSLSFRLCSPAEEEIGTDDISVFAPVGRAILFKAVGDEVSVEAPGGLFKYRIEDVRFEG